jgi:hypothetical protein
MNDFKQIYLSSIISVNSMVEVYPTTRLLDEYVTLPGRGEQPTIPWFRHVAETYLLKSWFATSLITNFLVTGFIIWRIFSQLPTARPIRATSVRFDLPDGNGGRGDPSEMDEGIGKRSAMPTWPLQFWRKCRNEDGWHWQSLYTRVVVVLIEAALPPALCGIASVIVFFSKDSVMTKQWQRDGRDLGQEVVIRLFMTLWLGTSVCRFHHVWPCKYDGADLAYASVL